MSDSVIQMKNIVKSYYQGTENELTVLHNVNMEVKYGEFISVVGASGSGKSTLMNIIGLLDRPTSGSYFLAGKDTSLSTDKEMSKFRNRSIGFVFQNYNLIPRSDCIHNVELPLLYAGVKPAERRERAIRLLEIVGMKDRMDHKPDELSGGQKQRVAIARAMANNPDIILADEPTGALDSKTGRMVMDLFHKLHEEENKTILLITHAEDLAKETQRMIRIHDGEIIN
jgi:putative ABC transport system ATP-binding protein